METIIKNHFYPQSWQYSKQDIYWVILTKIILVLFKQTLLKLIIMQKINKDIFWQEYALYTWHFLLIIANDANVSYHLEKSS